MTHTVVVVDDKARARSPSEISSQSATSSVGNTIIH